MKCEDMILACDTGWTPDKKHWLFDLRSVLAQIIYGPMMPNGFSEMPEWMRQAKGYRNNEFIKDSSRLVEDWNEAANWGVGIRFASDDGECILIYRTNAHTGSTFYRVVAFSSSLSYMMKIMLEVRGTIV